MPFEWIEAIPTEYQPLGEDPNGKSPSVPRSPILGSLALGLWVLSSWSFGPSSSVYSLPSS